MTKSPSFGWNHRIITTVKSVSGAQWVPGTAQKIAPIQFSEARLFYWNFVFERLISVGTFFIFEQQKLNSEATFRASIIPFENDSLVIRTASGNYKKVWEIFNFLYMIQFAQHLILTWKFLERKVAHFENKNEKITVKVEIYDDQTFDVICLLSGDLPGELSLFIWRSFRKETIDL